MLRYAVFKCCDRLAAELANAGPTILGYVVLKCCNRLAGALGLVACFFQILYGWSHLLNYVTSVLPRIFGRPGGGGGGILTARSLEALIGKVIKISELKCVCLTYLYKGLARRNSYSSVSLGDSVTFWETQLLPLHYYHFSVSFPE